MENELALMPTFHAVAVNATEMQEANAGIKTWLTAKVASLETIVNETQAALDSAIKNKWKTSALRGCVQREKQRHLYYGKLLAAVQAGYTIVPNMDVDVFAIRVKRWKPAEAAAVNKAVTYNPGVPTPYNEKEQRLGIGEGRYESPVQRVTVSKDDFKNDKGEIVHRVIARPVDFADIEFPLAIANAQVMDATAQAMSMKIFDRIGVVPRTSRRGDPIVLGQITWKQGWQTKQASFLIAWYLDPRTL